MPVPAANSGNTAGSLNEIRKPCWPISLRIVRGISVAFRSAKATLLSRSERRQRDSYFSNDPYHFPNLRIAYLGSRIYGGYADGRLNPEPCAYEGAFVVRWLIQSQVDEDADLNYDPERGDVKSPLLLWGPYFWADGTTPRKSDGLVWERSDLVGDGTHPSDTGRQKVADQLLSFFKTDAHAQTWFVKK